MLGTFVSSPLTPSTGMPGIGSLIIYAGLPLILLLNAWRGYSHQMAKYVVVLQGLCMLGVTGWLLLLQAGIFSNAG